MQWILIAITMTATGEPNNYNSIAQFETRDVCEYAPEALRVPSSSSLPSQVLDEQGKWVVMFRCVPTTETSLAEEMDVQDRAALFLDGKAEYKGPWWQERVRARGNQQ